MVHWYAPALETCKHSTLLYCLLWGNTLPSLDSSWIVISLDCPFKRTSLNNGYLELTGGWGKEGGVQFAQWNRESEPKYICIHIYNSMSTVLYMHAGFLVFSSEILLNLIFWQCSTFYNTYSTLHCLHHSPQCLSILFIKKLKSFFQFLLYRSFALFWLHCTGPCVQDGCLMLQYVHCTVGWIDLCLF